MACTNMVATELMDISGLYDLNEKQKSCSIFWSLSGVLEVKYDLDRTDMKKQIKTAKNCMHQNVSPDALPGFTTQYVLRTAGVTTVATPELYSHIKQGLEIIKSHHGITYAYSVMALDFFKKTCLQMYFLWVIHFTKFIIFAGKALNLLLITKNIALQSTYPNLHTCTSTVQLHP